MTESSNSEAKNWMIYGANGFTAKLIIERAIAKGLRPILGGRNALQIVPLAQKYNLETRLFAVGNSDEMARHLEGVHTLINCAGPFSETYQPFIQACIKARCNYLDITGEIDVLDGIHEFDAELRSAGVTAISGVGFDVVPSDALAALLKKELPEADSLRLLIVPRGGASKGTAKTAVNYLSRGALERRKVRIQKAAANDLDWTIELDGKTFYASKVPWGDVASAYYTTGCESISTYFALGRRAQKLNHFGGVGRAIFKTAIGRRLAHRAIDRFLKDPTPSQRTKSKMMIYGEAISADGRRVGLTCTTPDGYEFTGDSSIAAIERLLSGNITSGALTPTLAFGTDFCKTLPGVSFASAKAQTVVN